MAMEIMSMAILKSSATLESSLKRRSGVRYLSLSPDLPQMKAMHAYDMARDVESFGLVIRLKAEVTGNWYYYEESKWLNPVLFCSLIVDEAGMHSGFGFELVLEDLHKSITAAFYDSFRKGTLIYKEKDIEGLTKVYTPIEVLKVA